MITYRIGDATQPVGPPEEKKFILHVCNNYGGWGRGFVLALSRRWREPERRYREKKRFVLGTVQYVPVTREICVVNMIAQEGDSLPKKPAIRYDALRTCLEIVQKIQDVPHSIHMPRIGCGLGGGEWEKVEALLEEMFPPDTNINVYDLGLR